MENRTYALILTEDDSLNRKLQEILLCAKTIIPARIENIEKALLMSTTSFFDVVIIDENLNKAENFILRTLIMNPYQRFLILAKEQGKSASYYFRIGCLGFFNDPDKNMFQMADAVNSLVKGFTFNDENIKACSN